MRVPNFRHEERPVNRKQSSEAWCDRGNHGPSRDPMDRRLRRRGLSPPRRVDLVVVFTRPIRRFRDGRGHGNCRSRYWTAHVEKLPSTLFTEARSCGGIEPTGLSMVRALAGRVLSETVGRRSSRDFSDLPKQKNDVVIRRFSTSENSRDVHRSGATRGHYRVAESPKTSRRGSHALYSVCRSRFAGHRGDGPPQRFERLLVEIGHQL